MIPLKKEPKFKVNTYFYSHVIWLQSGYRISTFVVSFQPQTTDTQRGLFFKNSKHLGLGRQIGLKLSEAFGVFSAKLLNSTILGWDDILLFSVFMITCWVKPFSVYFLLFSYPKNFSNFFTNITLKPFLIFFLVLCFYYFLCTL